MTDRSTTNIKLSASGKTDPDRDIRGRTVKDRDGNDMGTVDDLLVAASDQKIRFLRVEHGGVLGFGATRRSSPLTRLPRSPTITSTSTSLAHRSRNRRPTILS